MSQVLDHHHRAARLDQSAAAARLEAAWHRRAAAGFPGPDDPVLRLSLLDLKPDGRKGKKGESRGPGDQRGEG